MVENLRNQTQKALNHLLEWLDRNGWKGYDPYDIKEAWIVRKILYSENHVVAASFSRGLSLVLQLFPLFSRKTLGIKKRLNAKGMGLFASAYVNLFRIAGVPEYRKKAKELLSWLSNHRSSGYEHPCWGYPFDWQSDILIPRGTPSAVVSSVVGDAFWKAYQSFHDPSYLIVCQGICRFFLTRLNIAEVDPHSICFSYTPLDKFRVHNANLFVSEFLLRIGKETGDALFWEMGRKAANFALLEQNADGSIFYWGRTAGASRAGRIDHYHSGFEIRLLRRIAELTKEKVFFEAASRYATFYRLNLLENREACTVPKMHPGRVSAVDIHACSEALLVQAEAGSLFPDSRRLLDGLIRWILPRMQTEKGYFAAGFREIGPIVWRTRIPYIRWGQAWMLYALSEVLLLGAAKEAAERSGVPSRDAL